MWSIYLKIFFVNAACLLLLNRQTICVLKRTDLNVCEILVSEEYDNSEAYRVECCLDYYEEDNICKPCKAGKFGRQCSETCSDGYYDSQCKGLCSCTKYERCDPVTGCECIDYTGTNCNYRCPAGFYGKNCVNICQCIRGIDCDSVTGSCICPAGFTGPSCTTKCLKGYFGENCSFNCSCSRNSVCDSISGECLCSPGFTGETCAERCPAGFYGKNCVNICQCIRGIDCDFVTGSCICPAGFTGPSCTTRCPAGFYGKNCVNICQCIRGIDCDSVTGSCICPVGFTGPSCTTKCLKGYFGENCSFNCSCSRNSVCDSISGKCLCSPGFTGETCAERCLNDFYGQNCTNKCHCANGLSCHPVHGTCQCQNGTEDCENFEIKRNQSIRSSKILIIGLSCSGGSLLLIGTCTLAVCFFKRKHVQGRVIVQPRRPLPEINHYDEINPYDEISLENMPVASNVFNVTPYYSYAQEQIQRLSLPITFGRINNLAQNEENRGYISLPNLTNDGTYLSPYYSFDYGMTNATNNHTEQPLQSGEDGNSGYLHPYNALHRTYDRHEYTKIEHEHKTLHEH